jgi:hypothetical protein
VPTVGWRGRGCAAEPAVPFVAHHPPAHPAHGGFLVNLQHSQATRVLPNYNIGLDTYTGAQSDAEPFPLCATPIVASVGGRRLNSSRQ